MNNGKVRIYELAKELGKENKDILEICAQLNISVKNHSSTITESQAEGIRANAEKAIPTQQSSKTNPNNSETSGNALSVSKQVETNKGSGKPEILAVHHKQRSGSDSYEKPTKSTEMFLSPPPRLPIKPNGLPTKSNNNDQLEEISDQTTEETDNENKTNLGGKTPIAKAELKTAEKVSNTENEDSSQLLNPPARPKKETPQLKTENKPVLKPVKKAEITASNAPPTKVSTPRKFEEGEKPTRQTTPRKPSEEIPKSPKLIQRPQKPKTHSNIGSGLDDDNLLSEDLELDDNNESDEISLDLSEKPKPAKLLKRPTPAKVIGKGGKVWEEEEEGQEAKAKAAKANNKNKRRSQILIEDEDDEMANILNNAAGPAVVSLSIVRPPKPKSLSGQSSGPEAATVNKTKKPTPKTESSSKVDNRDARRDKKEAVERPEKVNISGNLTIRELSELLKTPETEIIKNLFFKGIAVNITQTLDLDTATLVAKELGVIVENPSQTSAATKTTEMIDVADLEYLHRRPPVVTIMGHVDHGKTTLLDSIRKTKVAQGEAGGITQHIGAYHVDVEHEGKKQQIVFLDTPGHEAFTAMRARGARITDIAILVVAADDGVQPQTREAISHARAAEVPIVVAINKIDKTDSNPDRVKQELAELGLLAEEWGGDTIMVPVSALKGENLDNLLEMILLVSEVEELSANPDRLSKGTVIEANLDRTRGPVATLLVQNGTLRVGDVILAGSVYGKIKAMIDDRGNKVEAATPSFAVEILGLNDVPAAGDEFEVFETEREARLIAEQRFAEQRIFRLQQNMSSRRVTLSSFSEQAREGQLKELNLILKADVQGSVEAIVSSLQQLPQNEVQLRLLLTAPGEVTETDVDLAAASGAVIIGFNTSLASGARSAADQEGVDIREYNIIYKLLDDIQGAMEGLLDPEEVEEFLGTAEVRAVFMVGRGAVAGCYVQSGKVVRNRNIRVRRSGEVIYQGILDSLKRMKEDAKEVNAGYECGIGMSKFNDWKEGDIIESYQMVMKRRTLSVN